MALIFILLALLGFGVFSSTYTASHVKPHHVNCKARMGTGESRHDCGGPPANP